MFSSIYDSCYGFHVRLPMFQLILLICSTLFLILLMGMLDYVIGLMVWLGVFDGLE